MKGRGIAALAATAALTSFAAASFDLVLVLDRSTRAVHRYDGDTGTYLGAIGMPLGTTLRSMTLDQANQRVFVADSQGIHAYNYNTGQHLFSNFAVESTASIFWVGGTNGLIRASTQSSRLFRMVNPSPTAGWAIAYGALPNSSNYPGVAVDGTGDALTMRLDGTLIRVSDVIEETRNFDVGNYGQLSVRGTEIMFAKLQLNSIYYGSSQNLLAVNSVSLSNVVNPKSVAFGHENIRYVVGTNPAAGGQGLISRIGVNFSGMPVGVAAQFGSGQLVDPIGVAVVVAPEPGTMIALGAGVLALLRRRVRR